MGERLTYPGRHARRDLDAGRHCALRDDRGRVYCRAVLWPGRYEILRGNPRTAEDHALLRQACGAPEPEPPSGKLVIRYNAPVDESLFAERKSYSTDDTDDDGG